MKPTREMWFREERFERHPKVADAARELAGGGVVSEAVWAAAYRAVNGNDDGGESGAVVVALPVRPSAPSVLVVAA